MSRKRKNSEVSVGASGGFQRPRTNSLISEAEDGSKARFIEIRDAHTDASDEDSAEGSIELADLPNMPTAKDMVKLNEKGKLNAVKYIEKYGEWLCLANSRLYCTFCMKLEFPHKRMIFAKGGYDPQDLPDGFDVNCRQHPACVTHVQAIAPHVEAGALAEPKPKKVRTLPREATPETDGKLGERYPRRIRKPSERFKGMLVETAEAAPAAGTKGHESEATDEDVYWKCPPPGQRKTYNMMDSDDETESDDDDAKHTFPIVVHQPTPEEARRLRELEQANIQYYTDSSDEEDEYVHVDYEPAASPLVNTRPVLLPVPEVEQDEDAVDGLMFLAAFICGGGGGGAAAVF